MYRSSFYQSLGVMHSKTSMILALAVLFCFTPARIASNAEPAPVKRVLIISAGSRLAPGFVLADQQLLAALRKIQTARIEIYAENLDMVRFPAERYQQVFRDYLSAKYSENRPDLVLLVYTGNLGITGTLLPQLFPNTPIIVAGFTEEELDREQFGKLVSGIAQRVNPQATLDLIGRLQPEVNRVIVIGGTAETDQQVTQRIRDAAERFKGRLKIEFWDNFRMDELNKTVKLLPANTAILFSRVFRDAAGQAFISAEVARTLAQEANAPVYVMTETGLGTGAVGGALASIEAFAQRAGELARLVLTGTAPASLPLEIRTDTVPTFDWRALQRWSIPENRLPANSIVRFRPQSFWQEYRWYIIAALIIIGVQTTIIVDLLLQRRRRRRVEAELRDSRELMEHAASAGELGLWSRHLTASDVWANAPMRSLFGFGSNETVTFEAIQERIHPDDLKRMLSELKEAQTAGLPFQGEFRILLPNGTDRWLLAKGRTTAESGGGRNRRRMGMVIDISERKQAEEKLRDSEENFRRLVETTAAVIWQADSDNWVFTYVGPQATKLLGYPVEHWYEKDFWVSHIHPDDREQAVNTCLTLSQSAKDFTFEYRMIKASGEIVWIHDIVNCQYQNSTQKSQLRGLMLDISARKQAEDAVKSERQFLRQVIDIDPNFIFVKDREGRFTLANKAVADAYGTTVDNLIGRTDADFNPNQSEVESFRQADLEVIDTLQERFIPEERISNGGGRVRWLQTVKRPIIESDGSAKQVLGVSTDITLRKKTEVQLREQRVELAHVARISTMGELSASLAHELNQPLTAILSNAQAALRFLSSKPADIEEVHEILQDIVEDNRRAGEVIRRMRALVKKEGIEFASLDFTGLIREVVALVHSDAILQNTKISLRLKDDLPTVLGDKVQLQQVVLNLLLNAFDAMKGYSPLEREVEVHVEPYGAKMIKVAVSDRGTGLSLDKLDKIFEPFYTTKGEGLGMGLSICRSIIEAHGGNLWAENNPDRGATFYFTVPIGGDGRMVGGETGAQVVLSEEATGLDKS
jgi:PAS domain S-box-containing protein